MTAVPLHGHYGRLIAIDLCAGCNSVWFDEREDLSLAPGAVVQLVEAMGNAVTSARAPLGARKACPCCDTGLLRTRDRLRHTPFEYFRCTLGHGRFMGFAAFLRSRQFVRDLTAAEVRTLSVDARVIKCVNCGANTDIRAHADCQYCRAPSRHVVRPKPPSPSCSAAGAPRPNWISSKPDWRCSLAWPRACCASPSCRRRARGSSTGSRASCRACAASRS